jgi:hypothetical protein
VSGFVLANVVAALVVAVWYGAVMQAGDVTHWRNHSRLADGMDASRWLRDHLDFVVSIFVEWLPGSLLLGPAIIALWRRESFRDNGLLQAAIFYAGMGTLALLVWPGGVATRYAMPANLALAVLGGVLFDRWWSTRPWLIGAGNTVVIVISTYLVLLGWIAMPIAPDAFRQTRVAALQIEAVRTLRPGPLYVSTEASNVNVLASLAAPIRVMPLAEIAKLPAPALVLLTPADIASLAAAGAKLLPHAVIRDRSNAQVMELLAAN